MGDPVPLARPRFGRNRVYDSQKHKRLIATIDLDNQHNNEPFYEGPLHLEVHFFLKIAKCYDVDRKDRTWHVKTPDLDNMIKWVGDISQSILVLNDASICSITATKTYSVNPRTEFEIKELEPQCQTK